MDNTLLGAYLPMDRRQAMAAGYTLPERAVGTVLLADIAGFTPLTDALTTTLGPRRGAEEVTRLLNAVYETLIASVHRFGGSVIGFSGDGLLCWFAGDPGQRALATGLEMQEALVSFTAMPVPEGRSVALSIKVGIASGKVRRLVVGDPGRQRLDLLAGATLDRMARAERVARRGEVVVGPELGFSLRDALRISDRREGFAVTTGMVRAVDPVPWPALSPAALSVKQLRPFLLDFVYKRLQAGLGEFLAELRPVEMLFLCFSGPDYDREEEAGVQLDTYVRWVQDVLARYDGVLLQVTTGDKGSYLHAAFGVPQAHENDAERAVAAAMELRQPAHDWGIKRVQIGVSQGRVYVGAYGSRARRTYDLLGDEVNVAARLMETAPSGEIRCSGRIYSAGPGQWYWEALPPTKFKGKTETLPVYRPVKRRAFSVAHKQIGLVGRHAELAALTRLLDRVQTNERRVLLLEGEAGIGKSRLTAELARLIREREWRWLQGAGLSIEQGTPYRAWRDVLINLLGLKGPMEPAETRQRIGEQVGAVNPALIERAPLLNDILRLDLPETDLTRSFDSALRHQSLVALVIDLLRSAASNRPMVLVLEDAQWLDSLSWELVLTVARALASPTVAGKATRSLLVLVMRPSGKALAAEYAILGRLPGTEILHLGTLPENDIAALTAMRLGLDPAGLPPEIDRLVRERAGGNPFFAEELAYALRDSGALVVDGDGCTLTGDLATLKESVPDTVEGLVLGRIDRLPPGEQLTVKAAAVIGRRFFYRTLYDVHPQGIAEDMLQDHLASLGQWDLMRMEVPEPECTYLFKHIITQQVAYGTLLFAQRRPLHRAVAAWYEQTYADTSPFYPLLAHHYRHAEDFAQERRYARLAGEQAAAQFANVEAVRYFSRALELTPEDDPAGRYALLLARERVHDLQGQREAQAQDIATLAQLADSLDDTEMLAETALRQARFAEETGDYAAATAAVRAAIDRARTAGARRLEARAFQQWGQALWRMGDYAGARARLKQALTTAQRAGIPGVAADSLRTLGNISAQQSDYQGARDYYEQSQQICRATDDRRGEAGILNNLGIVAEYQGDHAKANTLKAQALNLYRAIGDRQGECLALSNLASTLKLQGDFVQSQACLEQAYYLSRELGFRENEGRVINSLGGLKVEQGEYRQGQHYFEQALAIQREIGNHSGEGFTLNFLGSTLINQGRYSQATVCLESARKISLELGIRRLERGVFYNLGRLARHEGDLIQARDHGESALRIARELGERRSESWQLGELGLISHQQGDNRSALRYGQASLDIARQSGAAMYAHQSWAWLVMGHSRLGLGQLSLASDAYRHALDILRKMDRGSMIFEARAGLARTALALNDLPEAQTQVEAIMTGLETKSLHGTKEPFRVYMTCYQVLRALQDPRARGMLTIAYRCLHEQAAGISDAGRRQSFLEHNSAHRQIIAAYEELKQ